VRRRLGQATEAHLAQPIDQHIDADLVCREDGRHVQGGGQSLAQTHGTMELSVVVVGREITGGGREVEAHIGQDGRGGVAEPLHRESVDEGFQCRARLAQGERTIVLPQPRFVEEVGRADIGKHLACLVLDDDDGAARDVLLRQRFEVDAQRRLRDALQIGVDRRRQGRGRADAR
jgi:hypothetical protein